MNSSTIWYSPAEAAEKLSELSGRPISATRLGQLRRDGKVKSHKKGYNTILYLLEDLEQADTRLRRAGRKLEEGEDPFETANRRIHVVTGEQIDACSKCIGDDNNAYYKVTVTEDVYEVRYSRESGFSCTCKENLCWHILASLAHAQREREKA